MDAAEVRERLRAIEDPDLGDDIVALDLINNVEVTNDEIRVDLALGAPYSPTETGMANAVREALEEERATRQSEGESRKNVGTDDSSTSLPLVPLLAGLAVVVAAYLLRQRGGESDDTTRPSNVDEQTASQDRVETEAPVDADD